MITVFGKAIPLYGLFCVLGATVGVIVAFFLLKKRKIEKFDFACAAIFILVGVLVGAKLLFVLVSIEDIIRYNITFMQIMQGGFVFYGGLIGGAFALWLYTKIYKENLKNYLDVCTAVIPLGHAFGRVGCFFGGCCYGMEYDGWLSYTYTSSLNPNTPLGVPLLPIQLIEAACLLLLFAVTLTVYLKTKPTFNVYYVYFIGYAIIRFILEFFRGDKERGGFLLSTSQWISVLIIVAVVALWIWQWKKGKKTKIPENEGESVAE